VLTINYTASLLQAAIPSQSPIRYFTTPTAIIVTRTISHIADGGSLETNLHSAQHRHDSRQLHAGFLEYTGAPLCWISALMALRLRSPRYSTARSALHRTAGTTPALNKGWAELTAPTDCGWQLDLRLADARSGDSEAAVPLSPAGGTDGFYLSDNEPWLVTGVAFADPSHQAATISGPLSAIREHSSDTTTVAFPPRHGIVSDG